MIMLRVIFLLLCAIPLPLICMDTESDVLIYTDPVEVNSAINEYANVTANAPIQGSIMVTHPSKMKVDQESFVLGDRPLKTTFVQTTLLSSFNDLEVSIYHFQLDGLKAGPYTLPPVKVKVGGKLYNAPQMTIDVQS